MPSDISPMEIVPWDVPRELFVCRARGWLWMVSRSGLSEIVQLVDAEHVVDDGEFFTDVSSSRWHAESCVARTKVYSKSSGAGPFEGSLMEPR